MQDKVSSIGGLEHLEGQNGAFSEDEAPSDCPSDCSKCDERFKKQRAKDIKHRLKLCESGDISKLESIQDKMAEYSLMDIENYELLKSKKSKPPRPANKILPSDVLGSDATL